MRTNFSKICSPIILLFILLVPSLSFAFNCTGTTVDYLPAVMGSNGGVVKATMKMIPGEGNIYIDTRPKTSPSTQSSAETAVQYAFAKAGIKNTCDTLINLDENSVGDYVDGPSAGASFAVMAYATITGIPPRSDTLFTGTIDRYGNVGAVGGLYEKASVAVKYGKAYFIMPRASLYERLLLESIEKNSSLQVYEVDTLSQAIDFIIYNKQLNKTPIESRNQPVPNLTSISLPGMDKFVPVADYMIAVENSNVQKIPVNGNNSAVIKKYFEKEIENQKKLLSLGYVYPAANIAFLDYIESETLRAMVSGEINLSKKKKEIESCIASLPSVQKTDKNFEWVIGADLRTGWALRQLNDTDLDADLLEEKYAVLNELLYADAWCHVSFSLLNESEKSGTVLNESAWQPLAAKLISDADNLKVKSSDSETHLKSAKYLYNSGKFGAAVFDAVYVLEMESASANIQKYPDSEINRYSGLMAGENRTSFWGNVYQSQGIYLSNTGSGNSSAYKILSYASALDSAAIQLSGISANSTTSKTSDQQDSNIFSLVWVTAVIITILLFFIIEIILKKPKTTRGSYGKNSNTPGRNKLH